MAAKSNIVLIGMPGSGKSTVGVILAKLLAKKFVDTDILIQNSQKCTLQQIIDLQGYMKLRQIEEEQLLSLNLENHIISTGGSAAYSEPAMTHLGKNGIRVFLHADLQTLSQRIDNYHTRGLAKKKDQSFEDLFNERFLLYTRFSEMTVDTNALSQEAVCRTIINNLDQLSHAE